MSTKRGFEVLNYATEPTPKKPSLLVVLLVFSSIYIVVSLFGTMVNFVRGPLSETELSEQTNQLYQTMAELKDIDMSPTVINMIDKTILNLEYTNNVSFKLNGVLNILVLLVGIVALFLMAKLKKIGFHLYIIYSLLPIVVAYIVTPPELVLTYYVVLMIFFGAFMSVLYGLNLKVMK